MVATRLTWGVPQARVEFGVPGHSLNQFRYNPELRCLWRAPGISLQRDTRVRDWPSGNLRDTNWSYTLTVSNTTRD